MIKTQYEAPHSSRRRRESLFGPHGDALAESLTARGYTTNTIRVLLSAARGFGEWLDGRGHVIEDVDDRLGACL